MSDQITELKEQIQQLENLRSVLGDEIVDLRQEKLRSELRLQIDTGGGNILSGHFDTGGGDLTVGNKVQVETGIAIGGNVQDSTIITGETHGDIHIHQGAQPLQIPPPPQPQSPPAVDGFIGRQRELADFTTQLKSQRFVVICGMPGMGKTWLACHLACQVYPAENIFWHTFHPGDGIEVIIWKLAAFLAWHGSDEIWKTLQSAQLSGGKTPPADVLYDYLFQTLSDKAYILCLDDFQYVEDDPQIEKFAARLEDALENSAFAALITTYRTPSFLHLTNFENLEGLALNDVRAILEQANLQLTEDLIASLHTQTGGNAQFIALAANALRRERNPARLMDRLIETDDIERFLIHEVDDSLDEDTRQTMNGIAALLGYPSLRDAIEATLDSGNLRRMLRELADRYLVHIQDGEDGREYFQTRLLQHFYYDLLSRRERRNMHARAGDYYEHDEPHSFKAALHYQQAGEFERAAELATQNIETLLNQGLGRPLRELLARFRERQLPPELWARVKVMLGRILVRLDDFPTAKDELQTALRLLEQLPANLNTRQLGALALRWLVHILQYESPDEALNDIQRGLEFAQDDFPTLSAEFYCLKSNIHVYAGNYALAVEAATLSLQCLSENPSQPRVDAITSLSHAFAYSGDFTKSKELSQQALALSRQLNDQFRIITILTNLGLDLFYTGDWYSATTIYQEATTMAVAVGRVNQQILLGMNTGWMHIQTGDDQVAGTYLSNALQLARKYNNQRSELLCLGNLGDLFTRQGLFFEAQQTLAQAEQLAEKTQIKVPLPEIYRNQALIQLAQGALGQAHATIERSLALGREMEANAEIGASLRVLGQILRATGDQTGALAAFEDSAKRLDGDPYEVARTQTQWGQALREQNPAQGQELLQTAQNTFERLGAKRDLKLIQQAVEGPS